MPKFGKVIVGFDESDRKEFVSGFRKRKQQRRSKAQNDIKLKARRDKLQERRDKRQQLNDLLEEQDKIDGIIRDDEHDAGPSSKRGAKKFAAQKPEAIVYEDEFTKKIFGSGTVVVETSSHGFSKATATPPSDNEPETAPDTSSVAHDELSESDEDGDTAVESLAVGQSALVAEIEAMESAQSADAPPNRSSGRKRQRQPNEQSKEGGKHSKSRPSTAGSRHGHIPAQTLGVPSGAPAPDYSGDLEDMEPKQAVSFLSRGEREIEELAYGGAGRGGGRGRGRGRGRGGRSEDGRGRGRGTKRRRVTTGIGKFSI